MDALVLYTNKYYAVVQLAEPIYDPTGEAPPLSYGVYNKETEVLESYCTFFPAAIQTVDGLSEMLDDVLPKEDNVVMFTPAEVKDETSH